MVKSVLIISRPFSAPSTTIKSSAGRQELRVSVSVRSVRSAECTIAAGFSTARLSDPEVGSFQEEGLKRVSPIRMFLSPKYVLLGTLAYLPRAQVLCPTCAIARAKLCIKQRDSDSLS